MIESIGIGIPAIISLIVFIGLLVGTIWLVLEIASTLIELFVYLILFALLVYIIFMVFDYLTFDGMLNLLEIIYNFFRILLERLFEFLF
jgi:hypothetical protein